MEYPAARRRAVAPQDKSERRAAIVRAAAHLLERDPAGLFSVDAIARRAGLAKGTVYLYFDTREEVLLAVHGLRSQRMFDALERALAAREVTPHSVTRALQRFLRAEPAYLALATRCRAMLESNIGAQAALEYKRSVGLRLAALGERIETLYPRLARGDGVALLMNCYALMLGLWQLADMPDCLDTARNQPELSVLRVRFDRQLSAALIDLWQAAALRGNGGTS